MLQFGGGWNLKVDKLPSARYAGFLFRLALHLVSLIWSGRCPDPYCNAGGVVVMGHPMPNEGVPKQVGTK